MRGRPKSDLFFTSMSFVPIFLVPVPPKKVFILLTDKILHHLTTLPWKGRIATVHQQ